VPYCAMIANLAKVCALATLATHAGQAHRSLTPYLTLPHLELSRSLPHLTPPYLASPYLTVPHRTSPYLTVPHLTSPFTLPQHAGQVRVSLTPGKEGTLPTPIDLDGEDASSFRSFVSLIPHPDERESSSRRRRSEEADEPSRRDSSAAQHDPAQHDPAFAFAAARSWLPAP
jgi:hypothetical protein